MNTNATTFQHDAAAMDDPKCMLLTDQLGMEGYGIYWALLEKLRTQPGQRLPLQVVPILARRFGTSEAKVRSVISGYGLFQVDDEGYFYSQSMRDRLGSATRRKEIARQAASSRWDNRQKELFAPGESVADEENTDTMDASDANVCIMHDACHANASDASEVSILNASKPNNQADKPTTPAQPAAQSTSLDNNIYINPEKRVGKEDARGKGSTRASPAAFRPPTVEEVAAFVSEKGYAVSRRAFCSFYESKGWMIGKNKMKNWKQAVVTWVTRDKQTSYATTERQQTAAAAYDGCLC